MAEPGKNLHNNMEKGARSCRLKSLEMPYYLNMDRNALGFSI